MENNIFIVVYTEYTPTHLKEMNSVKGVGVFLLLHLTEHCEGALVTAALVVFSEYFSSPF